MKIKVKLSQWNDVEVLTNNKVALWRSGETLLFWKCNQTRNVSKEDVVVVSIAYLRMSIFASVSKFFFLEIHCWSGLDMFPLQQARKSGCHLYYNYLRCKSCAFVVDSITSLLLQVQFDVSHCWRLLLRTL